MKSNYFKEVRYVSELLMQMNESIQCDANEGAKEAHDFRLRVEKGDNSISKEERDRFAIMSNRKMNDVKMRKALFDKLSDALTNDLEFHLSEYDT